MLLYGTSTASLPLFLLNTPLLIAALAMQVLAGGDPR
jgi:hypothetical protein